MNKNDLINYIQENYDTLPDYPWIKHPSNIVFRQDSNSKWFALMMTIKSSLLAKNKSSDNNLIDIINLKARPELIGALRAQKGIHPGYHMNKEHWITVEINNVDENDLKILIEGSYTLTKK